MKIDSFDTVDQMFAALRQAEDRADAAVQPWQAAVAPGDFFWTVYSDGQRTLTIYYEALEPDPDDAPLPRFRRMVRGYSRAEPDGEAGTVHCAHIWGRLAPEAFDEARRLGWPSLDGVADA